MTEKRLPALNDQVLAAVEQEKAEDKLFYVRIQGFTKILNNEVQKDQLVEHPFVKGALYLPISFTESMLDSLFFGLWETTNFKWERILNEVVGSIEVRIYHPVFKQWLTRTGSAAVNIKCDAIPDDVKKTMNKQDQNGWYIDPSNKKPLALTMGAFASFKAMCFRNACLSLGKSFGRDANRTEVSTYEQFLKTDRKKVEELRLKLSDIVSQIQDYPEKQKTINQILDHESTGRATAEYYQSIIDLYEKTGK